MAHGIYLSANNDSEGFRFPVNPPEVKVSGGGNSEEYTISKLGVVSIPKHAKLDTYPLETYFPKHETHYSETAHFDPQHYIDLIEKWKAEMKYIRYIYVDGSFSINELVTIEQFDYKESDASGDVYFELLLKKYVSFGPKKMEVVKKAVKATATTAAKPKTTVTKKNVPPRQNDKPQPQTYSMIKGDSLWKVAQKFLGNGSRYKEIQSLNGIKDSQLTKLPIGLKIKLPPKWEVRSGSIN